MNKSQAIDLVTLLKLGWPRQDVSPESVRVYAEYLCDLDFAKTKAAIDRLICSSKWFPTIAEIRAELAEGDCSALPDAEIAWGEVWKKIGSDGAYRNPIWSSHELEAAVDVIGWQTICLDENVMSTRARFIDAYRKIRERAVEGHRLGKYQTEERRLSSTQKTLADNVTSIVGKLR